MLPSYHQRDVGVQCVGLPRYIARKWVKGNEVPDGEPITPPGFYWSPEQKGTTMAVTGDAEKIGPVYDNLEPTKCVIPYDQTNLSKPLAIQLAESQSMERWIDPETRKKLATLNENRFEMIRRLGKTRNEVWYCQKDLVFKWDGMESEISEAAEKGLLENLDARPVDPSPSPSPSVESYQEEAAAPQTSAAILSKTERNRALEVLSRLSHKAEEWNILQEMLTSPYEVPFMDFKNSIKEAENEICTVIRYMNDASGCDHVFLDNETAHRFMKSLPASVLRLTGLYPAWVIESVVSGVRLSDSDCQTLTKSVGDNAVNFLKMALPLTRSEVGPEQASIYWVAMKPQLEKLLKEPFISSQEGLADDLEKALIRGD